MVGSSGGGIVVVVVAVVVVVDKSTDRWASVLATQFGLRSTRGCCVISNGLQLGDRFAVASVAVLWNKTEAVSSRCSIYLAALLVDYVSEFVSRWFPVQG